MLNLDNKDYLKEISKVNDILNKSLVVIKYWIKDYNNQKKKYYVFCKSNDYIS